MSQPHILKNSTECKMGDDRFVSDTQVPTETQHKSDMGSVDRWDSTFVLTWALADMGGTPNENTPTYQCIHCGDYTESPSRHCPGCRSNHSYWKSLKITGKITM